MPFNISGGASQAAGSLATTAAEANAASDKWDLEKQKIDLVDQLQTKHEEAGRAFTTSERVATEAFTGGENTKNRQNSVDIANISAKASVQAAGIGAGATIAAANIHANIIQKQMDQNAPLIAQQIEASKATTEQEKAKTAFQVIANSNASEAEKAQKEYAEAASSGDPDRLAKAGQQLAIAKFNTGEAQQQATATATLAKMAKDEMDKVQTMMALPLNQSSPERIAQLQGQYKTAKDLYDSRMSAAIAAANAVPKLPDFAGGAGGIIKYDAQGNRVTGAPAPTQTAPPVAPAPTPTPPAGGGTINGPM